MNGAFYQEDVPKRFESSAASRGSGIQDIYSEYVNRVQQLKHRLQLADKAAEDLNKFVATFDSEKNKERRAALITILEKKKYIDDTGGITYRGDMLGPRGILQTLNKLDEKVGEANDFVAGLGGVGTTFINALDLYLGKAVNEAVEQEQIDALKHIRRKGDFILQVDDKTKDLEKLSNQVGLTIQAVQAETQENNAKRTKAIKTLLTTLKDIDALETSQLTATINKALKYADQIASANRNLNQANREQLVRDKREVVDDVTRSMEAHKQYVPGKSIPTMSNEAPFLKSEGL